MSFSLELKSSTGRHREQLDDFADVADASSTVGEVLAVIGRKMRDGQEREGYVRTGYHTQPIYVSPHPNIFDQLHAKNRYRSMARSGS